MSNQANLPQVTPPSPLPRPDVDALSLDELRDVAGGTDFGMFATSIRFPVRNPDERERNVPTPDPAFDPDRIEF